MNKGEIKAEKILLKKIFSKEFWFIIPDYQRPYVWKKDNVHELMDDLKFAFNNRSEDEYFLGSLVLKSRKEEDGNYEVLDGQQRLTTFTTLLACLRDGIEDKKFKKAIQDMIFTEEDVVEDISSKSKITTETRRDVQKFIEEVLMTSEGTENLSIWEDHENKSIFNIVVAIKTIKEELEEVINNLTGFIKFLSSKVVYIYVSTNNTEDAFRMFTILNNRGIPLSSSDILKSKNLSVIGEGERGDYTRKWEEIENKHDNYFDRFLEYIRTILLKEKARKNLLEEFEENVYKKGVLKLGKDTFDLVEKYDDIYEKLIEFRSNISNEIKNLITVMKIGFESSDWIPPLLKYYEKFGATRFKEFTEKLEYKFAGDWITKMTPTRRKEAMNKILRIIDKAQTPEEILLKEELFSFDYEIYDQAINGFVYRERYCKYLLLKLEYLYRENEIVHFNDFKNISIEHVLPQNPKEDSEWKQIFTDEDRKSWTHRLCNLVLLSKRKNSKLSNTDFGEKKDRYLNGRVDIFHMTKLFIDQTNTWDHKVLENRQVELMKRLKSN